MKFKYRGAEYDTEKPLEVNSLRDLGAYIIIRYPTVPQNRMLIDRGYDSVIRLYLYTPDNKLTRDSICFIPANVAFTDERYWKIVEKRVEKILIKRGFI